MCIIESFVEDDPPGKSPWTKQNVFSLVNSFSLDKIPKLKICHMVAKEHPEVIGGRQRLIDVGVLDSEEAAEDDSLDHDGDVSDEEYGSSLVGEGVTKEVEDIQKSLKYSSLSSYIMKPSHLLTPGFEKNRTAQENLFKNMCNTVAPS